MNGRAYFRTKTLLNYPFTTLDRLANRNKRAWQAEGHCKQDIRESCKTCGGYDFLRVTGYLRARLSATAERMCWPSSFRVSAVRAMLVAAGEMVALRVSLPETRNSTVAVKCRSLADVCRYTISSS